MATETAMPIVDPVEAANSPNRRTRTSMREFFQAMVGHFRPSSSASTSTTAAIPASPSNEAPATKRISFKRLSFYKRRSLEKEAADGKGSNRTNGEPMSEDSINVSQQDLLVSPGSNSGPMVSFVDEAPAASEDSRRSSHIPAKKRQSSRRFLGISRDKSQKFEITEDMINLQRIICDKTHRQRLIELLVPLDGDSSVKVRFCCAVEEYQREKDKKERTRKAAQIVKMFVKKGSLFRLKGIPQEQETSLKAKKYEALEDLKNIFLDELGHNQIVAKTMRDILSIEANDTSS